MLYDLSNELHRRNFKLRCNLFFKKGGIVELSEHRQRTVSQNNYLHLIIGILATELGESLEYVKQNYFKRLCNPELFVTEVDDKFLHQKVMTLRSSADLTKEEMTQAIERFRYWAAEQGYYLPEPEETDMLRKAEVEISRNKTYL